MIINPKKQSFKENHKLMIGSIVPRPIALVSTISQNNIKNLAPFSYFNGVCSKPPTRMFAPARRGWDGKEKDTLQNIRETKEQNDLKFKAYKKDLARGDFDTADIKNLIKSRFNFNY